MKKDLITILCMTLVCASVMLGVMGLYKIVGAETKKHRISADNTETTAFRSVGARDLF